MSVCAALRLAGGLSCVRAGEGAVSRGRCLASAVRSLVAVFAALAVAAPLPPSGDHWAGRIGRHLVAPAEAHKAPTRAPRGARARRAWQLKVIVPAFVPLPRAPAVRTPPRTFKAPAFAPAEAWAHGGYARGHAENSGLQEPGRKRAGRRPKTGHGRQPSCAGRDRGGCPAADLENRRSAEASGRRSTRCWRSSPSLPPARGRHRQRRHPRRRTTAPVRPQQAPSRAPRRA